jgi:hypothetical protein
MSSVDKKTEPNNIEEVLTKLILVDVLFAFIIILGLSLHAFLS